MGTFVGGMCVRNGTWEGESWQEAVRKILGDDGEEKEWLKEVEETRNR